MEFTAFGKWILLGEHAVIRGNPALVFPLESRELKLRCLKKKQSNSLSVHADSLELEKAIFQALNCARDFLKVDFPHHYEFSVSSSIPLRAGLGSSAALSVTLGHFLEHEGLVEKSALFSLCHQMENIFHGTSSGIDIAAVLAGKGIYFTRGSEPKNLALAWKPKIYLFDTGERSSTADCVQKVNSMGRADLDQKMRSAVELGIKALADAHAFEELKTAILVGQECFQEWGLISENGISATKQLYQAGAKAVKPTGSGGGGFLLSLWQETPPESLDLIPVFI